VRNAFLLINWMRVSLLTASTCLSLSVAGIGTVSAKPIDEECARELKDGRTALKKRYGKWATEVFSKLLKKCTVTSELLYGMGTALKLDGKPTLARPYLERAIAMDRNNAEALMELGELYTWSEADRSKGTDMLRTALQLNPKLRTAQKILGTTLSWSDQTRSESIEFLSAYAKDFPADTDVQLALAKALSWTGKTVEAETRYFAALKLRPTDADATYELALLLAGQQGRRDEALALIRKAIDLKPSFTQARFAQAMVTAWSGRYREAVSLLKELRKEHPDLRWKQGTDSDANLTISLALARVLSWSREYDESEKLLREILAGDPEYFAAKRELGMLLSYQYARRAEAVPILTDVTGKDPKDKEAKLALAQAHIAMKYPERAQPLITSVLSEDPEHPLALKTQGNLHVSNNEPEKAAKFLERARAKGMFDADTANALANSYLALDRPKEAEETTRAALAEAAEDPRLQLTLAKSLIRQKRVDEGLQGLRRLSDTDKLQDLAEISFEFAGPKETRPFSIELCRKTLAQDPGNTHCLWSLGKVLSWSDSSRDESLKLLLRYTELKPQDVEAKRYYAEVLSWSGRKKQALVIHNELLKIEPDNLNVQASRAQVLSWSGKVNPAISQYRSILRINPKQKEALVGLGQCLNWRGDNLEAERVFNQAIVAYPNAPDVVLEQALNYQRLGRTDLALKGAERTIVLFDTEGNI
jgi:tetratricopeptide (TPR) repeat protein